MVKIKSRFILFVVLVCSIIICILLWIKGNDYSGYGKNFTPNSFLLAQGFMQLETQVNLTSFASENAANYVNSLKNNKNTAYLINFWRTDCAPCLEEIKSLAWLDSNQVPVVLVNVEEPKMAVVNFLQKNNIALPNIFTSYSDLKNFNLKIGFNKLGPIPQSFLTKNNRSYVLIGALNWQRPDMLAAIKDL